MKKATKKWMAVLMLLVMLLDAAPLPILAEELPQGSDLLTANYSESKQLDITLPEYTLAEDEFTVSPVKDMQSLISAVNKPVLKKRGLLNTAARNTAEQNQQADAATASITGYAAFDIKLAEGVHKADSYSVPVSFDPPIDVFADNPDRNASIVSVSCTLYHFLEDGSYTVVQDARVDWADNLLTGFTFTTDGFSAFLLKYTVDFVYIEKKAEITIDLDKLQKNGNELGQFIQKNSQELEEIAVTDILSFIAQDAANQDLHTEVYTVSLSNGTALDDFGTEFFSSAAVSIEGALEYGAGKIAFTESFETAKITFSTEKAALTLILTNYVKPEKPIVPETEDGFVYRFFTESATVADILTANEIVSSYYNIVSLSDENLVTVEGDALTVNSYFGEVVLTVALSDGTEVEIKLQNPAPIEARETVITEGVGSFAAAEEVPDGTKLVVNANPEVPEGITIGGAKKRGGPVEFDPVFFEVSLVGPQGEKLETGADVTLHTDIKLPEAPEGQSVKVTGVKVYHIGEKGDAEELEGATYALAEGKISSVSFTTPGFSLFAITYTVEYIEINYNGVINLNFNDFEPYPAEGADAAFVYDTDTCDIRVSVESVLNAALSAEAAGDGVVSEKPEIENFEIDIENLTVTSAEGGVIFIAATDEAEGMLIITADGSVELTDGEKTLTINISGITKLSEEILKAEGVEIQVEKGNIPLGSEAQYTAHTDEETARIVDEYKLTIIEGEGNGFSSADLKIVRNEEEVNAEGQFKVTIEKSNLIPEGMKLEKLYHIHDGKAEEVAVTENEEGKLEFEVANFSDFVASYTVDFHYNGKDYSIPGYSQILLSELIDAISIRNAQGDQINVADVSKVEFTDEHLVKVEQVAGLITYNEKENIDVGEKDFLLTSLEPFSNNEILTITMANGEVIEVGVTDAQTSNDLSNFLSDATLTIDGKIYTKDEPWPARPNVDYQLKLTFTENTTYQFDESEHAVLTYTIPAGITMPDGQTGSFDIPGGIVGTITGNTYRVSGNQLIITLGDDPKHLINRSSTTKIEFPVIAQFSSTSETVLFKDDWEQSIDLDGSHDVNVKKTGYYDSNDGKVHYTLTLTSTGENNNITVTDTLSGDLLNIDTDSFTYSDDSRITDDSTTTKGFVKTISSMSHGETFTINYTASVDLSRMTPGSSVVPDGEGSNSVKVEPEGGPEKEDTTIIHDIKFSNISKRVDTTSTDGDNKTVTWKIVANADPQGSIVGAKVKDSIEWNSRAYMNYANPMHFNVVIKDQNGNIVKTITDAVPTMTGLTWGDGKQKEWEYTIPDAGNGVAVKDQKYTYEITYDTVINTSELSNKSENTTIKNNTENEEGGSDTGTVVIPGTGGGSSSETVVASKEASEVTEDTITWKITVQVPAEGYNNGFTITDTLPSTWQIIDGNNSRLTDQLISWDVTGLVPGEECQKTDTKASFDYLGQYQELITGAIFDFSYVDTDGQRKNGLKGTGNERTLTLTLRTKANEKWKEISKNTQDSNITKHTNIAGINNTQVQGDAILVNSRVFKNFNSTGTWTNESGDTLPAYVYIVNVSDVSRDTITLYEHFDTTIFQFAQDGYWVHLYGMDNSGWPNMNAASDITIENTSDGVKITAPNIKKNERGEYYKYYTLVYQLRVKSKEALKELQRQAVLNGGKYTFGNTVDYGNTSDHVDVEYEVEGLKKTGNFKEGTDNRVYTFTLDINKGAVMLNNGANMELEDTHSDNLSIDYTSIQVTTADGKHTADEVMWDVRNNTATFQIPDETHYIITYDMMILGEGQQHFSNSAVMKGFTSSADNTANFSSSASGSLDVNQIKVLKHKTDLTSEGLNGAVFQLFMEGEGGTKIPMTYGDGVNKGKNITFTTAYDAESGKNGVATIALNETDHGNQIRTDVTYYLKEISTPPGSKIKPNSPEYWSFTLTNDYSEVNYNNFVYFHYGDVLRIENDETTEPQTIKVNKVWENLDGTALSNEEIASLTATIQLRKKTNEGEFQHEGTPVVLNQDNNWEYTWSDLPRYKDGNKYAYDLIEIDVPENFASSVETTDDGNVKTYTFTNTKFEVDTTDLLVKKVWQDADGNNLTENLPDKITFSLYRVSSLAPLTYTPTSGGVKYAVAPNTTGNYEITASNMVDTTAWAMKFKDLPLIEVSNGVTMFYAYYVKEVAVTGYDTTVTQVVGEDIVDIEITNVKDETQPDSEYIDIGLKKNWQNGSDTNPPAGAEATFRVHQLKSTVTAGNGPVSVTVSNDGGTTYEEVLKCEGKDTIVIHFEAKSESLTYDNLVINGDYRGWLGSPGQYEYTVPDGTTEVKIYSPNSRFTFTVTNKKGPTYSEYVPTSFDKTITLPTPRGAWSTTIRNLVQKDADGNLYKYYITEESCTPTATEVTFKDNLGNTVASAIGENRKTVVVTNHWEPQTGSLKIAKTLKINGADVTSANATLANGTYTFEIWNGEGTQQVTTNADGNPIDTLSITVTDGVASPLTVEKLTAGTYLVVENSPVDGTSLVEDTNITTVNGKKGILVTVEAGNESNIPTATFTNNKPYTTKATVVTKRLNKVAYTGNDFTFTLKPVNTSESPRTVGDPIQTVNTVTNGSVAFASIEYTAVGEYVYEIGETGTDSDTMDYADPIYVKIVVSEADGVLTAADPAYFSDIVCTAQLTDGTLDNIELGELDLSKTVVGGAGSTLPTGYEDQDFVFTIALTAPINGTLPATVPVTIDSTTTNVAVTTTEGTSSISVTLKNNQTAQIKKLPVGTVYSISETPVPGYTVSWHETNDASGTISKTVSNAAATNTFTSVKYKPEATKYLNGEAFNGKLGDNETAATFTFYVKGMTKVTDGETTTYTINTGDPIQTVTNDATGTLTFSDIEYNTVGEYYYQISEQATLTNGTMRYADPVYLKVVVNATLTGATGTYYSDNQFENSLTGNPVFNNTELTSITANKAWVKADGTSGAPTNGTVTFDLYQGTTKVAGKSITLNGTADETITDYSETAAWTATWTGLDKYDSEGHLYAYTVKEALLDGKTDEGYAGYTVSYPDSGSSATTGQTITNTQKPVSAEVKATKVFTDLTKTEEDKSADSTIWPSGGFTFTLAGPYAPNNGGESVSDYTTAHTDAAQVIMPHTLTVNPTSDGVTKTFEAITFKKAGTYYFTVTETAPATPTAGMLYDTSTHHAVVTVTEDDNGVLSAAVTYPDSGSDTTYGVVITNKYDETASHAEVSKTLTGRAWKDGDTFTFSIAAKTDDHTNVETSTSTEAAVTAGKVVMPSSTTAIVTATGNETDGYSANGNAIFGDITFKEEGTYLFEITETGSTSANGITYSQKKVYVKFEVTRDENTGELSAPVVTYAEAVNDAGTATSELTYSAEVQTFTNKYTATGEMNFKAHKTFTNGTLTAEKFTFKLTQVKGENSTTTVTSADEGYITDSTQTKSNPAADGTETDIIFDSITFTKDLDDSVDQTGTYWFLLEEEVPTAAQNDPDHIDSHIKYDVTQTWVKVDVTDSGNGNLDVKKYRYDETVDAEDKWIEVTGDVLSNPDASFVNEQLGSVQVTKTFAGIVADQIPNNFQIIATWGSDGNTQRRTLVINEKGYPTDQSYSDVTITGSNLTRTWTISDLPIGTVVTFEESNCQINGYYVTSEVTSTTVAGDGTSTTTTTVGISGSAEASQGATLPDRANVSITNTYTAGVELPSTGGPGTTFYTASGLTLLLGASFWLLLRRRREQN